MSINHSLRCMKCFKTWERAWLLSAGITRHGDRDSSFIKWRNVQVVGETKNGTPICKCKNCGHTYRSNSICAMRALKWEKQTGNLADS